MPAWTAWERGIKRSLLVWHRRAGKDELSLNKASVAAMLRPANYWHGLPQFNQARRAIWEAVNPHTGKKRIDEAFPKEIRTRTDQTSMTIEFVTGSVWRVVGLDNPDSLVGAPPAGIVLSEFALANPSPYAYLSPIINENDGWMDIITTPRGNNHVAKLFKMHEHDPKWFVQKLTVDDTGAIPLETIEADRKTYTALFGEEAANALIQQEYWCFPAGTRVWTSKGQIQIEEVRLGDQVMTHTGRWRAVKKLYQHETTEGLVEIHNYGSCLPLRLTANHPVRVCDPPSQTYTWKPALDVVAGDFVVLPRPKLSELVIDASTAELIAWFIAEGSIAKTAVQFTLNATEMAFADRIEACAGRFAKCKRHGGEGTLNVIVASTGLSDFLTTHCGTGAANKRIPWVLIAGHEELVYSTLIDGDGCRGDYSGVSEVFTTISYSLALDVQALAHAIGKRATITRKPKEKSSQVIQGRAVNVKDSYAVRVSPHILNKRNQTRVKPQKHGVAAEVKSVSRIAFSGPVFNLGVAYDESYIAEGRVVHNCSFEAAILGAYYAREMERMDREGRIGSFPPWPGCAINTAWDLGVSRGSNTMAVLDWQIVPTDTGQSAIRILSYDTASGYGIPWFAQRARERRQKWLAELRLSDPESELPHGIDYVPHDARTPEMTSSGHDGKAKQRIEVMIECGMKPKIVPNHHVADGISAVRQIFPRVRINEPECGVFPDALREYQAEWDDDLKKFKDTPLANWAAHPADAKRYLAMAFREAIKEPPPPPARALVIGGPENLPNGMQGVTLEDMWKANRKQGRRRL